MNLVLLLTACINCDGMPFTNLNNAETRKRQYIDALTFYLRYTSENIVFVENSGTDISSLFKGYQDRIEFLCFNGNSFFDKRKGKVYGEALILEYDISNSNFITSDTLIFKLTGRLQLININRLLKYVDKFERTSVYIAPPQNCSVDSRCFISNKAYLENIFLKKKHFINDSKGYYFEHLLFDTLNDNIDSIRVHKIPFFLHWEGISASLGDKIRKPKFRYWSDIKVLYNCVVSKL